MIVIDKKGNEVDVEPVDAREYVASGEYKLKRAEKPKAEEKAPAMTVKELTKKLEEMEIEIPEGSKKADLQKLLEEAE